MGSHRVGGLRHQAYRPLLLAALALTYGLLYTNRHWLHWPLPTIISSYLADVLALPLILSGARWLMRHAYFRRADFTLPAIWVISTWAGISIWFELLLPYFRPHTTTADGFDVIAYALGGLIFWRWLNLPPIHHEDLPKEKPRFN